MTSDNLRATERTRLKRLPRRGSRDRETINRILDEGLVCHVGFAIEGRPYVIPMAYARRGQSLLLHGSVASRLLRGLGDSLDACVTVTLLDGVVLARSAFHHSFNYRSVVLFGKAAPISDPREKRRALDALVEHIVPGRTADARGANEKELAATAVLELPIDEGSAKIRTGPPVDDKEDMTLPVWAGVIPLEMTPLKPLVDPDVPPGVPVPGYAARYRRGSTRPGSSSG